MASLTLENLRFHTDAEENGAIESEIRDQNKPRNLVEEYMICGRRRMHPHCSSPLFSPMDASSVASDAITDITDLTDGSTSTDVTGITDITDITDVTGIADIKAMTNPKNISEALGEYFKSVGSSKRCRSEMGDDDDKDTTVSESDDEPEHKRFRSAMGEIEKIDWFKVWNDFRHPTRTPIYLTLTTLSGKEVVVDGFYKEGSLYDFLQESAMVLQTSPARIQILHNGKILECHSLKKNGDSLEDCGVTNGANLTVVFSDQMMKAEKQILQNQIDALDDTSLADCWKFLEDYVDTDTVEDEICLDLDHLAAPIQHLLKDYVMAKLRQKA